MKMKWGKQQRYTIIELTVLFKGQLITKALTETFGISRAQASKDLAEYQDQYPANLEYDRKRMCYLPTNKFQPGFLPKNGDEMLRMFGQYTGSDSFFFFGESARSPSPIFVLSPLNRVMNWKVVCTLSQALHQKRKVRIAYQSLSSKGPTKRDIVPHTFVNNGYRWHFRAYCETRKSYRDYLPARIIGTPKLGNFSEHGIEGGSRME